MPKFPFALLTACSLCAQVALAKPSPAPAPQEVPDAAARATGAEPAKPAAAPDPDAKPEKSKKKGFFGRMFHGGSKEETTDAASEVKPTSAPAPKKHTATQNAAAADTPKPATAKPTTPTVSKPVAAATVEKPVIESAPAVGRKLRKSSHSAVAKPGTAPLTGNEDPALVEKSKYDEAKTRAMQDPEVQRAKEKADTALSEEDGRVALRAYNRALFGKMRELDDSIRERIDTTEEAILKRLSEKP